MKPLYCLQSPIGVSVLCTEVVNILPSFLTRIFTVDKNLLVSFSIVILILGCLEFKYLKKTFSIDLIFKHAKTYLDNVCINVIHPCQILEANFFHDKP